jgi:hypothetical protein
MRMPKIFPHTADGDQLSVSFDYDEERRAFEKVLENIRDHLEKSGVTEGEVPGFKFDTTLQYEVANQHSDIIRKIFSLQTFNVWSKDSVSIFLLKKNP